MSTLTLDDLLSRLDHVRRSGSGWSARCPSHDDRNNSLSASQADGKILLCCHAGCDTKDVLTALGLSWSDLFEPSPNGRPGSAVGASARPARPNGKTPADPLTWWASYCAVPPDFVRTLPLADGSGKLAFLFAGQAVRKLRSVGSKDYTWDPAGAPTPPLWPMPPAELPERIWLAEGESDCTVLRYVGL